MHFVVRETQSFLIVKISCSLTCSSQFSSFNFVEKSSKDKLNSFELNLSSSKCRLQEVKREGTISKRLMKT